LDWNIYWRSDLRLDQRLESKLVSGLEIWLETGLKIASGIESEIAFIGSSVGFNAIPSTTPDDEHNDVFKIQPSNRL
jgi:hypothetical protein